ncbi:hypothetical protein DXG01_013745 [Tephrocybe rancida]|nr:hypothetical protein DXG01_013745 [Tephrocybe rancida]
MYESNVQPHSHSATSQSYASGPSAEPNYEFIDSDGTVRESQFDRSYLSESPSPIDPPPSSSYPHDISATHSQGRRSSLIPVSYLPPDRYNASPDIETDRYSRAIPSDKYSESSYTGSSLDQRRMSEPAILSVAPNPYSGSETPHRSHAQSHYSSSSLSVPRSSAYVHSLQRGSSMSSLRDLRHAHLDYPAHAQPHYSSWKDDYHRHMDSYGDDGFDAPISPLQPDFSGGLSSRGAGYSPTAENLYGISPPGTGTSTSSFGPRSPTADSFAHKGEMGGRDASKTYSFVALPGNSVKKRPRRRYDEIERLYQCSWPDCNKAYGTLNHLNAHVTMQKHGVKRQPNEFKELRKQWRKAKKSTSPAPMRRSSLSLRHEGHEYSSRRFEPQGESSTPLYTRQPSYHGAGVASSASSALLEQYSVEERDGHLGAYSAHARQRYSGSAPWHGASRSTSHQFLSSSLPNQSSAFPPESDTPLDARALQPQRSRSQSSLDPPMGRLPPDSTLLTPLPGYQASLLPPLQEGENQDISYPAEAGFQLYDEAQDVRPHTGHGSLGDNEEKY